MLKLQKNVYVYCKNAEKVSPFVSAWSFVQCVAYCFSLAFLLSIWPFLFQLGLYTFILAFTLSVCSSHNKLTTLYCIFSQTKYNFKYVVLSRIFDEKVSWKLRKENEIKFLSFVSIFKLIDCHAAQHQTQDLIQMSILLRLWALLRMLNIQLVVHESWHACKLSATKDNTWSSRIKP